MVSRQYSEQGGSHGCQSPVGQVELMERYDELVVNDDDPVHEYDCAKCGGRCCRNTEILLNPFDIYRIVTNETLSNALGVKDTHDLFSPRGNEKAPSFFELYLGPESRLPLARINMVELGGEETVCPFNAPILPAKDGVDPTKMLMNKFHEMAYVRSDSGAPARVCLLEDAKPTICRAYPLGRAARAQAADNPSSAIGKMKMRYIRADARKCDKFKKGQSLTVRDYVKKRNLDTAFEAADRVYAWFDELDSRVKDLSNRFVAGILFYDFDFLAVNMANERGLPESGKDDLVRRLRPATFDELLERGQSIIKMAQT